MNKDNIFVTSIDIFTDGDAWCIDYDGSLESSQIYLMTDSFKNAKKELVDYLKQVMNSLEGRDHVVVKLNEAISYAVKVLKSENNYFSEDISCENEKEEFLMDNNLGNQNVTISIQEVSIKKTNVFTKFVVIGKEY